MPAKKKTQKKPAARTSKAKVVPATQRGLGTWAPTLELMQSLGEDLPFDARAVVERVPVDRIRESNHNARKHFDKDSLNALAESIREVGLKQPITVRPHDGSDGKQHYEVVFGHRRLRAFKILGLSEIPALIETGDELDTRTSRVVENLQREDLSPYEEALAFQSLIDAGVTQADVARRCSVAIGTVKNRLRLLRLPDELARRVGEPGFSAEHAQVLVPLAELGDEAALEKASALVGQKHQWRNRPMLVDEFRDEVYRQLKKSGKLVADSYDFQELKSHNKTVAAAVKAAPKVNLGGGVTAVVATPDVKKAVREVKKRRAKARAASGSSPRSAYDYQFETQVDRETEARLKTKIPAAVKGLIDTSPKALVLLAQRYVGHYRIQDPEVLAEASGIPTADVKKLGRGKPGLAVLEKHAKRDAQSLVRLLVAHAIEDLCTSYAGDDELLAAWIGTTYKATGKAVRRELTAAKKASKKKAPKRKPGKAKEEPFNELIAECPDCSMTEIYTEPDGTLREHRPKSKKCPGAGKPGIDVRSAKTGEPHVIKASTTAANGSSSKPQKSDPRGRECPDCTVILQADGSCGMCGETPVAPVKPAA